MMYTLWQSKKKIHTDNLSCLPKCNCYAAKSYVFLTLPNTSVQTQVIGKTIDRGGDYGLEIPVSHHFQGHKKGENWFKNRLETNEKDIKHCLI